ncbi:hypothetical protein B0H63DRAFT_439937 [Podospora didyma]|uniref:Polyketide synthase n=1 Tax=Podospora didyma TaxID=330526 RepID=A0AAE0K9J4_9PEZI|nr:hypothetical protein B0H63DRAFT_439937 [Podospora didyma]
MAYKNPISEPIAIIGSSCRFTGGATSPSKLWDLLSYPTDLSVPIPPERFNIKAFYHPDGEYHGTTNSPKAYFLDEDHRVFDASFFNITPKEAEAIDPQQRVLLEVVYEALERAGYTLQQYAGANVAVFTGLMTADYDTLSQRDDLTASQYYATGNARSIVSNRISYFFNFNGPSMTIDTACSSSLVALHQAVLSLRSGESEMACVTGANLIITPEQFIVESNLHMLSPSGHCRMWDAGADGYARGEGVAAMFIKPLSKALIDGDRIEAIIRETGVNSDGRSKGITMPNWEAQARLIKNTYRRAGLNAGAPEDRCQFFEAHGTGTLAGDPNEARAIEDAFFGRAIAAPAKAAAATPKLLVGSVKTVIGHTEGAAGLAGLMKVVEAMHHGSVPPNLHLDTLNPEVKKYYANMLIPTDLVPWPVVPAGQPKRASVNSFGFGGTNSHAIVEQYVPELHDEVAKLFYHDMAVVPKKVASGCCAQHGQVSLPLVLSANSQKSLVVVAQLYRDYLLRNNNLFHCEEVAWHTYAHRTAFPYRLAVSGSSAPEMAGKLDTLIEKTHKSSTATIGIRARPESDEAKILGIFTGQGAQWATMSSGLLRTSEVYAKTIRGLDKVLQACPHPPTWTLEQEILAEEELSRVSKAAISQPLCTALQIAFVDLLNSLGITFHTVVGHSSGEIAAAYAAGRLCSRDAILISYYRGLYAHLACGASGAKGGMLAAGLSKEEAAELCAKKQYCHGICIAASNAPFSVTLSGDLDIVHQVCTELGEQNKFVRTLQIDTAYHSPHMEIPAVKYLEALNHCGICPLPIGNGTTWISSVYGSGESDLVELRASYWKDNMVKPVLFYEAVGTALEQQGAFDCAIEVGPHPALKGPATQTMKEKLDDAIPYSGVLSRKLDDRVAFAEFLGWMWTQFGSASPQIRLFVLGSAQPDLVHTRLEGLPVYPWDHSQIHYRESRLSRQYHFKTHAPHELLGSRTRDDNEFELRWRNIMKLDKLPWVKHHSFQGQALLPASAYLVMAVDAAKMALAGRPASVVELLDLKFPAGITLEPDSVGLETLFSLTIDPRNFTSSIMEASFTLTSATADGSIAMKKNFSGKLRVILGAPDAHALPMRPQDRAETLHTIPEAFYDMMVGTGLVYTGPFRGLATLERRYNFASGTAKKLHPEDTTRLSISPAALDSCLQTAFVTISSPGDKAIWTSFLPEKMERVRFNLALCDIRGEDEMIAIDANLTEARPITQTASASFTADLDIFDASGHMEIQVEGLTVGSFTSTKPEDDYELYLTTVMDVDPEDKIISTSLSSIHSSSPMLVESCERVASFYFDLAAIRRICDSSQRIFTPVSSYKDLQVAQKVWPKETNKTLDHFIRTSPYFTTLNFIRSLGENLPDVLLGMLPTAVEEAHQLLGFQKHVSRVVSQISHKYPRMNVLTFTDPELGLTEHVLSGLKDTFLSFRIGATRETNLDDRALLTEPARKKVSVDMIDLDANEIVNVSGVHYDLVVLTTSLLPPAHSQAVLRKIRQVMRPGAFLLLVDVSRSPLKDRIRRCASLQLTGSVHDHADGLATPPDWPDVLDVCGFRHSIKNSQQYYPPGFSLTIRQTDSHAKHALLNPFAHLGTSHHGPHVHIAERLLVVGGKQLWTSLIAAGVVQALSPRCGQITTAETLDHVARASIESYSAVILLNDIDEPILAGITATTLEVMKGLLRPQMVMLWVTHNARNYSPDHAASFGFVRTLIAETPGLVLQMLDLDTIDTCPAVDAVVETFARLSMHVLAHTLDDGKPAPLLMYEPEIHIEDGHRLIPRVLPFQEANDRVNAPRRVVSKAVNTLETRVEITPTQFKYASSKYETKIETIEDFQSSTFPHESTLQVDYSTADLLNVGLAHSANVCIGRDIKTGKTQVLLSKSNASYIKTGGYCVVNILPGSVNQPVFLALLVRYLTALTMANVVEDEFQDNKSILLVEPDVMFQECAKDILVKRGIWFQVCATDANRCRITPGMTFIHPRSSTREIMALFPPNGTWVFDLLPESSEVSYILIKSLPKNCEYNSRATLFASHHCHLPEDPSMVGKIWAEAVGLALAKAENWSQMQEPEPALMSIPELLEPGCSTAPFQLLDWRAERSISHIIKPFVGYGLLSPNKTYVLVGLTRDFGQSLCTLFIEHGARNLVLASRNPPKQHPKWQVELLSRGINVQFEALDVTNPEAVVAFKNKISITMPHPVGGIINGAMVLEDKVFSVMSLETLHRVMGPKTIGSKNLDTVFDSPDLDFFIMTSSFAAIGGHPGQSNYAAANMYMNGLAASRRQRGLSASVLNIGVIYGLGFLHREKDELYEGLEREGYPPISERDIHHMFTEAIAAGKPVPSQVVDLTTGLRRYPVTRPTLHWHHDPRFSHFTLPEVDSDDNDLSDGEAKKSLKELLSGAETQSDLVGALLPAFIGRLEGLLHIQEGHITGDNSIVELGVDSLVAVEIRSWFWKNVAQDVAVMKILATPSITKLCVEIADAILHSRMPAMKLGVSMTLDEEVFTPVSTVFDEDLAQKTKASSAASSMPNSRAPSPTPKERFASAFL